MLIKVKQRLCRISIWEVNKIPVHVSKRYGGRGRQDDVSRLNYRGITVILLMKPLFEYDPGGVCIWLSLLIGIRGFA